MPARHLATASLLVFGLAACGGDDGGAAADAGIDAPLGDPSVLVGNVIVELVDADPVYTKVDGVVKDKAEPSLPVFRTMTTDGDCQLRVLANPFCTTPCAGTEACVADDTCAPYGTAQDLGTVHVTGVHTAAGAAEFDLVSTNAHAYSHGAIALAYPGFAEGDPITVTASGSAFTPAFTMTTTGIAPLEITSSEPALDRDSPLTATWTPAAGAATSRIQVKLDISHHGGLRGKITCDTADDGSLTITAALMTQLLDLGVAGFPTIELTRVVVGSGLTTAGRVDLSVRSMISQAVTVPGVISCTDDTECTPPATCQDDLTCR